MAHFSHTVVHCISGNFPTLMSNISCKLTDQVNESFVDFVIGVIESTGGGEHGEELVDALVPLILAFNQHFVGRKVKFCHHCN